MILMFQLVDSLNLPNCRWNVKDKGCPDFGTYTWLCLENCQPCTNPYRVYHCARDQHNKQIHTETCALERECKSDYTGASVCSKGYYRGSNMYSECIEEISITTAIPDTTMYEANNSKIKGTRYRDLKMPFKVTMLTVILICLCKLVESNQNCEWDVKVKGCPNYGTHEWDCLARSRPCHIPYHVYHCAKDYHNKEVYTEACALEKDCKLGTEPQIWTRDLQDDTDKVTCELCFGNRYNDVPSQSSAMCWQCSKVQPEYTDGNHLINCHVYTSNWDLKTKRQWSRCDARHNFMLLDRDFDSNGCSNDTPLECAYVGPCSEGQERLPNYTCVAVCSKGYRRPNTSDECIEESILTTQLPESTKYEVNTPSRYEVNTPSIYEVNTPSMTVNDTDRHEFTTEPAFIVISVAVVITIGMICLILYLKRIQKNGNREFQRNEAKTPETDTFIMSPSIVVT